MVMVAVIAAVLRGPLSDNAGVAQQGLWAIVNLVFHNGDNSRLLGAAGACKGE